MTSAPELLPVTAPAEGVPGPARGCWTYDDYAAIPEDGRRYEVIDGVLYLTPAPNTSHQQTVGRITAFLMMHVELEGRGRVLVAPTDVELHAGRTVVQPDVLVVLKPNESVITPARIVGAPDLAVEVGSPSTATYDRRQKMDAYASAGVREYWLVDPIAQSVELLALEEGAYRSRGIFRGGAMLPSAVIPGFPTAVEQFFP